MKCFLNNKIQFPLIRFVSHFGLDDNAESKRITFRIYYNEQLEEELMQLLKQNYIINSITVKDDFNNIRFHDTKAYFMLEVETEFNTSGNNIILVLKEVTHQYE